jgi:periplasmic protein TonB
MSTAVVNPVGPRPFNQDDSDFRKFLVYSLILHAFLVVSIVADIYLNFPGTQWGGIGGTPGSVKVNLVAGPSAGIPMLPKPTVPESKAVDETNGRWKEVPAPKPPELKTPAVPIPIFKQEKPLPPSHKSKVDESKIPPPDNAVPYGKGGNPQLPNSFATQPASGSGPVAVNGQGGGDFAARYAWYVEAVRRRISQNWLQSTIDPAVRAARQAHCVMTFRIYRDGTVKAMQLTQSSGNLSMDNSAQRALLSSNPMPPLPSDYSGSYVDVTFDFDLSLNQ